MLLIVNNGQRNERFCECCSYVTDSVVAVTVCMFLFIVPARKPNFFCLWNPSGRLTIYSELTLKVMYSFYWKPVLGYRASPAAWDHSVT